MASEDQKVRQVLLRPQPKTYDALLKKAAAETVKRGKQVSVPKLVLEIVEAYLDQERKAKAAKGS